LGWGFGKMVRVEPLTPETEKRIALLFPPEQQEMVRVLLLEQCGSNIPLWESAGLDRLHFAVLKLSQGKMERLRDAIDRAKMDFRDVLVRAGFSPMFTSAGCPARNGSAWSAKSQSPTAATASRLPSVV
jgi:hypothetical protein